LEDAWEYEVSLALSVSGGGAVAFSLTPGGGANAGYVVATVRTDNPSGYTLSMEASGGDLVCSTNAAWTIPSIAADGALADDTWGYGLSSSWTGSVPDAPGVSDWKKIPVGAADTLASSGAVSAVGGDDYGVYFGGKASFATPACNAYKRTLTITAVGS
jgi:hypothetical protein